MMEVKESAAEKSKSLKAVLRSGVEAQTNTNNEANYQPIGLSPK